MWNLKWPTVLRVLIHLEIKAKCKAVPFHCILFFRRCIQEPSSKEIQLSTKLFQILNISNKNCSELQEANIQSDWLQLRAGVINVQKIHTDAIYRLPWSNEQKSHHSKLFYLNLMMYNGCKKHQTALPLYQVDVQPRYQPVNFLQLQFTVISSK